MEERPSFSEIVVQWRAEKGPIPANDPGQLEAYADLFATLELHGYGKMDTRFSSNFNHIIHHAHNPNSKNAKNWAKQCVRTLNMAIALRWPHATAKAAERPLALVSAPSTETTEPTEVDYSQESAVPDYTKESEVDYSAETDDAEAPAPAVHQRTFTQEEWDAIPPLTPTYDPEMRKLLGYDDA